MALTTEQIANGFWHHNRQNNFPPASITYPDEYDGSDRLNLVCTQLGMSAYQQHKLVGRWTEILPTLEDLRYLWLSSRVGQDLFEAVCEVPGLIGRFSKKNRHA